MDNNLKKASKLTIRPYEEGDGKFLSFICFFSSFPAHARRLPIRALACSLNLNYYLKYERSLIYVACLDGVPVGYILASVAPVSFYRSVMREEYYPEIKNRSWKGVFYSESFLFSLSADPFIESHLRLALLPEFWDPVIAVGLLDALKNNLLWLGVHSVDAVSVPKDNRKYGFLLASGFRRIKGTSLGKANLRLEF
jgi:hypothetical protein